MANDSWDISIQVLEDTLHQQVDPSHALVILKKCYALTRDSLVMRYYFI
jgi:hypothetical protein